MQIRLTSQNAKRIKKRAAITRRSPTVEANILLEAKFAELEKNKKSIPRQQQEE